MKWIIVLAIAENMAG